MNLYMLGRTYFLFFIWEEESQQVGTSRKGEGTNSPREPSISLIITTMHEALGICQFAECFAFIA